MPTALITGLFGQDGSLLAELLLARGYRVVGIVRPGAVRDVDATRRPLLDRCDVVEIDVGSASDWAAALVARVQPDEIYHLAACHRSSEIGQRDGAEEHARMDAVNVTATVALAGAAQACGCSLVVACSSQMYTPALPALRIDERTACAPATHYGKTKSRALEVIAGVRARGLRASCAILFNHESPRRSPAFASRKITRAAARIAAGLERTLELADLSSRVDFSSAADVVEGLHAMGTAPQHADRVIASGELHSLEDLCQVAFAAVRLDWRHHVRSARPPGERAAVVGDPTKIERELGWSRKRSFTTWIEEMVEADRRAIETP